METQCDITTRHYHHHYHHYQQQQQEDCSGQQSAVCSRIHNDRLSVVTSLTVAPTETHRGVRTLPTQSLSCTHAETSSQFRPHKSPATERGPPTGNVVMLQLCTLAIDHLIVSHHCEIWYRYNERLGSEARQNEILTRTLPPVPAITVTIT